MSLNDDLRLVSSCPVCETKYQSAQANVLGEEGGTRLLHVHCRKCQNAILALVVVNQVGASSVGLLTDLTYEDVMRFRVNKQVNINDVIDIHTVLEQTSWFDVLGVRTRRKILLKKEQRQRLS